MDAAKITCMELIPTPSLPLVGVGATVGAAVGGAVPVAHGMVSLPFVSMHSHRGSQAS